MAKTETMVIYEASKYKMLADYYKYSNTELHMWYYQKYLRCVQQLVALEEQGHHYPMMYRNSGGQLAYLRLFHAVPDAPAVDVYVNGKKVVEAIRYKESTNYLHVNPGTYVVEVYPTGEQTNPVLRQQIQLTRNTYYTAAATGTLKNINLNAYVDQPYVSQNQSKVRFIHLSPDAPNVDIAVKGGTVLFRDVPFSKATDYLTIAPTTADIEVRISGMNEVVLTVPNVRLEASKTYTFVAVGLAQGLPKIEAIVLMP